MVRRLAGWRIFGIGLVAGAIVLPTLRLVAAESSPFLPSRSSDQSVAAGVNTDLEALQFSGVSIIGPNQLFNFVDPRTRASFWVGLNQTRNGFTVESYDPQEVAVVVRHGASTRRIALRKPTVASAPAPAAVPATQPATLAAGPVAQPAGQGVDEIKNPKTPEEIKQAEFEARMLVSDLLEISMRERERQRVLREQQARGQNAAPAVTRPAPANVANPSTASSSAPAVPASP